MLSYETAVKTREAKGEDNNRWKGSLAGYASKHQFLKRNYGNPEKCDFCGIGGRKEKGGRWSIHWAKKHDRDYTHDRKDYHGLCRVCHGKYDLTDKKREHLLKMATGKKGKSIAKSRIALTRNRDEHGHYTKTKT